MHSCRWYPRRSISALDDVEAWLHKVEGAAQRRIGWVLAQARGDLGRLHVHGLIAGVDHLTLGVWRKDAVRRFGDCQLELYDDSKGGAYYVAKNGLSESGDFRFGGCLLSNVGARALLIDDSDRNRSLTHRNSVEIVSADNATTSILASRKRPNGQGKQSDVLHSTGVLAKALDHWRDERLVASAYVRIPDGTPPERLRLHRRIQQRQLEDLIIRRSWRRGPSFVDEPQVKAARRHHQRDALIDAARKGDINVVLVTSLDKLAPNCKECVSIVAELTALNVYFVSLHDGIDTTTARGRASLDLVTALMKMEHSIRSERVEAGIAMPSGMERRPVSQLGDLASTWTWSGFCDLPAKAGARHG